MRFKCGHTMAEGNIVHAGKGGYFCRKCQTARLRAMNANQSGAEFEPWESSIVRGSKRLREAIFRARLAKS
jgi:hypothetical protein